MAGYPGLVALQEQYGDMGFQVLAFPCQQYGHHGAVTDICSPSDHCTLEPSSNTAIHDYAMGQGGLCESGATCPFPMFAKSNVKSGHPCTDPSVTTVGSDPGPGTGCEAGSTECCPQNDAIYDYIRSVIPGNPTWNFDKYLIAKDGTVASHFGAGTETNGCGPSWADCTGTTGFEADLVLAMNAPYDGPTSGSGGCADDADGVLSAQGWDCSMALAAVMSNCEFDMSTSGLDYNRGILLSSVCPVECGVCGGGGH
jgi:glutathione peroxidase-family protein